MFKVRASQEEWLDRPDSGQELVCRSHALMRRVNRCLGGTRVVRRFLQQKLSEYKPYETVSVLDIGSGSCDIAIAISEWARRRAYLIQYTCVEKDPTAFREGLAAIERSECTTIRAYHGDIFDYEPSERFEFAVGSMFFHHLPNRQILRLIGHLRKFVRRGVFINDLQRSPVTYAGGCLLSAAAESRVRHDVLLSIRKGFVREELAALLVQVEDSTVSVSNHCFGRITAWIEFTGGGRH